MQNEWFDIKCPNCGDIIPGKESYLKSTHKCPNCKKQIKFIKASSSANKTRKNNNKSAESQTEKVSRNLSICPDCNHEVSKSAKTCPKCGSNLKRKRFFGCLGKGILFFIALGLLGNVVDFLIPSDDKTPKVNKTKANQSSYNQDVLKATTSKNLSNADLAWHAQNTYGWNCNEVTSRGKMIQNEYFIITCSNGTKLRVYPRPEKHPKITNIEGSYQ